MPTFSLNGISLFAEITGPAEGLPLILLHAFPLRGAMWHPQTEALARDVAVRVIVPDLRGFGATDASPGPYPMEQMASDVLALADSLGIDRFVLGGLSMGGYIAFALARQASSRLRGIILADTRAGADTPEGKAGREVVAQQAEREGPAPIAEAMLPRLLSATGLANSDLAEHVREMIISISGQGIAGAARGMALRPDSADVLALISCPALVIVGENDVLTPVHESESIFAGLPDATLQVIPEVGHLSNVEDPVAFNTAAGHFLRGLR
jgi:3-oxoadipate enol-lactonase